MPMKPNLCRCCGGPIDETSWMPDRNPNLCSSCESFSLESDDEDRKGKESQAGPGTGHVPLLMKPEEARQNSGPCEMKEVA